MTLPVIRVSIFRVAPEKFDMFARLLDDDQAVLGPGIRVLPGFRDFWAGADRATSSFVNVSFWDSVEGAQQLDHYEPMLALGRRYVELGAAFERPIMNFTPLWRLHDSAEAAAGA